MAQLQPPPYQDKAGTQRWSEWYRQINDLLSEVSTSINAIDDVEIVGATQGDILYYNATEAEWQNTETPVFPSTIDVEGSAALNGGATGTTLAFTGTGDIEGAMTLGSTVDVEGVATFSDEIESESAADGIGIDDGNYIYALERGVSTGPTIKFNTHGTHLYYLDLRSGASTNGFEIIHTSRNGVYGDGAHFYLLNVAHNSAAENSNAGICLGGVNSFEKVATFTPQPNTGNINYFRFESNTTGLDPILSIESASDTNVGMDIVPLGTGVINVANQIMGPTTAVTAATHTVDAEADRYLLCDTTSNAIDVELPAASTAGDGYRLDVKVVDATNSVTINENGTDEIDGAASQTLSVVYENLSLLCTGSTWHII